MCLSMEIHVTSGFSAGAETRECLPNLDGGSHRVFRRCRIRRIFLRYVCDCMTQFIRAYLEYGRGVCRF